MDLTILVAKMVAIIYMAMGISILSGQVNIGDILKSFRNSSGLTLISGMFMVVTGTILVDMHNIWEANWTVLVTIIAWALLIKGIVYLVAPTTIIAWSAKMAPKEKSIGYIIITIALVMGYFGFMS